jgi:hypothetical protein
VALIAAAWIAVSLAALPILWIFCRHAHDGDIEGWRQQGADIVLDDHSEGEK